VSVPPKPGLALSIVDFMAHLLQFKFEFRSALRTFNFLSGRTRRYRRASDPDPSQVMSVGGTPIGFARREVDSPIVLRERALNATK
jgi:hypothetical protein